MWTNHEWNSAGQVYTSNDDFPQNIAIFRQSLILWFRRWRMPAMWETWILSLGSEDPLEEGYVYPLQDSCLENAVARAGYIQSMGSRRVRHDWGTLSFRQSLKKRGPGIMLFIYILCLFILCHKGTNNTDLKRNERVCGLQVYLNQGCGTTSLSVSWLFISLIVSALFSG